MAISQDHREWVLAVLEEYEDRLMRFAARLLRDEEAAHDVVQHVFLRLCDQRAEELADRVALWLFTVCRNRAVDLLRQRDRAESLTDQNEPAVAGGEPDPSHALERGELHSILRRLVDELPDAQREVVDLWIQGFKYREISEITGRSEGHIRLLNHRALKRLREHPQTRAMLEDRCQPDGIVLHQPSGEKRHAFKLA